MLRHKDNVYSHIRNLVSLVHTQFDCVIKYFRSDNGTEFCDGSMCDLFHSLAILKKQVVSELYNKTGWWNENIDIY